MGRAQDLREYAGEKYGEKVEQINRENSIYSTKLAAILKMLESYYNCYTQNKREIIKFASKVALENAGDDQVYIKQIHRTTKNKMNKIQNMDARFDKFVKEFLGEFTDLFHGDELEENLLDAFDAFWEENVTIEPNTISVNGKLIK